MRQWEGWLEAHYTVTQDEMIQIAMGDTNLHDEHSILLARFRTLLARIGCTELPAGCRGTFRTHKGKLTHLDRLYVPACSADTQWAQVSGAEPQSSIHRWICANRRRPRRGKSNR